MFSLFEEFIKSIQLYASSPSCQINYVDLPFLAQSAEKKARSFVGIWFSYITFQNIL